METEKIKYNNVSSKNTVPEVTWSELYTVLWENTYQTKYGACAQGDCYLGMLGQFYCVENYKVP